MSRKQARRLSDDELAQAVTRLERVALARPAVRRHYAVALAEQISREAS